MDKIISVIAELLCTLIVEKMLGWKDSKFIMLVTKEKLLQNHTFGFIFKNFTIKEDFLFLI